MTTPNPTMPARDDMTELEQTVQAEIEQQAQQREAMEQAKAAAQQKAANQIAEAEARVQAIMEAQAGNAKEQREMLAPPVQVPVSVQYQVSPDRMAQITDPGVITEAIAAAEAAEDYAWSGAWKAHQMQLLNSALGVAAMQQAGWVQPPGPAPEPTEEAIPAGLSPGQSLAGLTDSQVAAIGAEKTRILQAMAGMTSPIPAPEPEEAS